jgi:membrane fusion protein, heavy metal efflux system
MKFLSITLLIATTAFAAEAPPRKENTIILDARGVRNLGIETVTVEESTFERTLPVLGEITHTCEGHSVLSSRIAGKIIEVGIHKGEFVKKGDTLLRIESRQPGDPPPIIELKAPADGLVVRSDGHLGAPVEPDKELMEIQDLTKVWVLARVPQHQAALLRKGLTARVHIPASGKEAHESSFVQLNTDENSNPSAVDAIFELPNPGMKLRPGMRAELSLIVSKREGVTSIPRDALQGERSNRFIFIKDYELKNAFVRVPVTVGEIGGDRVEITKGLLPGDEVVLKGAYSLSFAGKGSVSLREAMDAAHGHPHNEDGTEMTKEQLAAGSADADHPHSHGEHGPLLLFLAIACGMLFVLLLASPFVIRNRALN